mgnify:CR=1 FL=1
MKLWILEHKIITAGNNMLLAWPRPLESKTKVGAEETVGILDVSLSPRM